MSINFDKTTVIKWFIIVSSGFVILAYLSNILYFPIFLEDDFDYGVPKVFIAIIFILIKPIAFSAMIFIFYQTYFHLFLWQIWLVLWVLVLHRTYKMQDVWDYKTQISIHMTLIIIVLIYSAILHFFLPATDIIFKLATQVYWIVPLWLLVWIYGWLIEIPQTLMAFKRISVLQTIWVCFFAILSVMALFYVGSFILEVSVYPIF